MQTARDQRRTFYLEKTRHELDALVERGVRVSGNAFSSVLFLKGEPNEEERVDEAILKGADGTALRAALTALGYPPEDWCALLTTSSDDSPLEPSLLREAICTLDPSTLVACDEAAAQSLREAYSDELTRLADLDEAMLTAGKLTRLLGMRILNLGGFEAALTDDRQKQLMWARLKQIPPLGAPY